MRRIALFLVPVYFISLFVSCRPFDDEKGTDTGTDEGVIVECPEDIASRAFSFAELYRDSDTEYKWGGQDPLRSIKLDCSGLVVMCYKYALVDTSYSLLFDDTTAYMMFAKFSFETESPRKGDLVFMGSENEDKVSHIALFSGTEEDTDTNYVVFIDSTQKRDDEGKEINGVTERKYKKDDKRIKAFGRMKLLKKTDTD